MLHFCCDYRGTETNERYYSEEVHQFRIPGLPANAEEKVEINVPPRTSYLGKISRRGKVRLA